MEEIVLQSKMSPDELIWLASELRYQVSEALDWLLVNYFNGCLFNLLDCITIAKGDDRLSLYYDADSVFERIIMFRYVREDGKLIVKIHADNLEGSMLVKKWGKKC